MAIRVLSVDGGGIRGIGSAHVLVELEKKVKALGGASLSDMFDLFVGTSTGCILAAGLAAAGQARGDFSVTAIERLYRTHGKAMFTSAPGSLFGLLRGRYLTERKGETLAEILGGLTLGALERNFMGTFYNIGAGPGPMFVNGGKDYRKEPTPDDKYHDWPLCKVVNASSSAPIYFDPATLDPEMNGGRGVDGGLFANNPAMCALVEARNLFSTDDIVMVSVGTGQSTLNFPQAKRWGLLGWAAPWNGLPLLQAMFDGQSSTVAHQASQVLGDRLYRFQFDLDGFGNITMDDTSDANLDRILKAAGAYLAKPDTQKYLEDAAAALMGMKTHGPAPVLSGPTKN